MQSSPQKLDYQRFLDGYDVPSTHFGDVLEFWTNAKPDSVAFRFSDSENEESLTYRQLQHRVRSLAGYLQSLGAHGQRILLLYPPGLEFVVGFFACHESGAIAVPAYPPRRNRKATRIHSISVDSGAKFALSTQAVIDQIAGNDSQMAELSSIQMVASDNPANADLAGWKAPKISSDDVAVLQYTSGSTGDPKGVMLSHANLIANVQYIIQAFGSTRNGVGATWLPTYHDMGLVGGVLKPLYYGRPNVLMSPMAFLQKPARWLEVISKYRVTISGGPNFAFQLCVDKVDAESIDALDLSCWDVAFNGAEPVRPSTLDAFAEKFARAGFRREAFLPCYGMAETTLIVTGGPKGNPTTRHFSGTDLNAMKVTPLKADDADARALVACGKILPGERVEIVNPDDLSLVTGKSIGEIWVQSPCVGKGYWHHDEKTKAVFNAYTAEGHGPFLRTGDFGFVYEDQLYVTGRLKDMIIVRGVNRYPQDIELTCEQASAGIQVGAVAAMAMDWQGREQLVIVAETVRRRDIDWNEEINRIRKAVTTEHELPPDGIFFVRSGSVPKTSSGKIQRHACLSLVHDQDAKFVAKWARWETDQGASHESSSAAGKSIAAKSPGSGAAASGPRHAEGSVDVDSEIMAVVVGQVRAVAQERAGQINQETNIAIDLGLDSLERLQIANSLEQLYGGRFPDEVLAEMETVAEVVQAIETHLGGKLIGANPALGLASAGIQADGSPSIDSLPDRQIVESDYTFRLFPEYLKLKQTEQLLTASGHPNPYFSVHQGLTRDTTTIDQRELISFASYNYLGMSGDPVVCKAACDALQKYGTSVSASRLVSGNKPVHEQLERDIAEFIGTQASIVFVGGHSTNETTIGHLMGAGDLILHDSLAHNSIVQGAILSGARRRPFAHNDFDELDKILAQVRRKYRRVLVVIEGVYSMDGDYPELPKFVEIKKRHQCLLMVDEAHSIGTMGKTGRGLSEHFGVDPSDVDLWMGTLSKALGSCGGYIAGCSELVEYLRYTAPGFVYSVGLPPASAAAALASLEQLKSQPQRVAKLRDNCSQFVRQAKAAGLDIGLSKDTPVVPVITGSSLSALQLSQAMFDEGINVQPILYPAVEDSAARLRFFITSTHTPEQIQTTIAALKKHH